MPKNLLFSEICVSNFLQKESWKSVLTLAYQSLGVVYGDLSTSPLYVYKSTFAEDIQHSETNEEIYGVLSFVFWTLTLVPLLKYVFIVLSADDNGEGGTFALYSLLCRHTRISCLPNCQAADEALSAYVGGGLMRRPHRGIGAWVKSALEKNKALQKVLLFLALIGTCMVIGDGVLTPALSGIHPGLVNFHLNLELGISSGFNLVYSALDALNSNLCHFGNAELADNSGWDIVSYLLFYSPL